MAYSEPSIRPKISQIVWLRYFCSAARIALMEIATPASTPKPGVGAQQGQPHHDTSAQQQKDGAAQVFQRGGPVLAAVIDEIVQNAPQQFAVGR